MNPFVLVGFDLLISAVLVLLAMCVVWIRIRTFLADGAGGTRPGPRTGTEGGMVDGGAADQPGGRESGALAEEVTTLTRQGCSVEETARRLQIPTREVETVLAISRMGKARGADSYASAVLARMGGGRAVHSTAR